MSRSRSACAICVIAGFQPTTSRRAILSLTGCGGDLRHWLRRHDPGYPGGKTLRNPGHGDMTDAGLAAGTNDQGRVRQEHGEFSNREHRPGVYTSRHRHWLARERLYARPFAPKALERSLAVGAARLVLRVGRRFIVGDLDQERLELYAARQVLGKFGYLHVAVCFRTPRRAR